MSDINFSNLDDNTLEKIVSEIPNENNDFLKELNKRKEAKKINEEQNKKELEEKEKKAKGEIPFVWAVFSSLGLYRYIEIDIDSKLIKNLHNFESYDIVFDKIKNYFKDRYDEDAVEIHPLYIKPTDK